MSWKNYIAPGLTLTGAAVGAGLMGPGGYAMGAAAGGLIGSQLGNYYLQQEQYDYQKALQQEMFAREDTSIARRVADLRANGMSATLAAGQGASAGPVVKTDVPQLDNTALGMMQMAKMKAEIDMTRSQNDLIWQNITKSKVDMLREMANVNNVSAEAAIKWHDYSVYRRTGTTSNAGTIMNMFRNAASAAEGSGRYNHNQQGGGNTGERKTPIQTPRNYTPGGQFQLPGLWRMFDPTYRMEYEK